MTTRPTLFTDAAATALLIASRRLPAPTYRVVRQNGTQVLDGTALHRRAVAQARPHFPAFRVRVEVDGEPLDVLEDL